jgi:hypothetical protein
VRLHVGSSVLAALWLSAGCGEVLLSQEVRFSKLPPELETAGAAAMVLEDEGETQVAVGDRTAEGWRLPTWSPDAAVRLLAYPNGTSDAASPASWTPAESSNGWRACLGTDEFILSDGRWVRDCAEPTQETWRRETGRVISGAGDALAMVARHDQIGGSSVLVLTDTRTYYEVDALRVRSVEGPPAVGMTGGGDELVVMQADGRLLRGPDLGAMTEAGRIAGPWQDFEVVRAALAVDVGRIAALVTTHSESDPSQALFVDWVADGELGDTLEVRLMANSSPAYPEIRPRGTVVIDHGEAWLVASNAWLPDPLRWIAAECGLSLAERPDCLPLPRTPNERIAWESRCSVSLAACAEPLEWAVASLARFGDQLLAVDRRGGVYLREEVRWNRTTEVPGDPTALALSYLPADGGRPPMGAREPVVEPPEEARGSIVDLGGTGYEFEGHPALVEVVAESSNGASCRPRRAVFAVASVNEDFGVWRFARSPCTPLDAE